MLLSLLPWNDCCCCESTRSMSLRSRPPSLVKLRVDVQLSPLCSSGALSEDLDSGGCDGVELENADRPRIGNADSNEDEVVEDEDGGGGDDEDEDEDEEDEEDGDEEDGSLAAAGGASKVASAYFVLRYAMMSSREMVVGAVIHGCCSSSVAVARPAGSNARHWSKNDRARLAGSFKF